VESALKRQGHRSTTVETVEQLSAILSGGRFDVILVASGVAVAVEKLLGGGPDAPVVVAFCVKAPAPGAGKDAPCAVKAPPRERSLLEAIDKAVERHDRNARRMQARG
jgi:hypothetical protein